MDGWLWVLFWWVAFAATHLGLSDNTTRAGLIARLGDRTFMAVYSLISFATFVPLVLAFRANRLSGPQLWDLGSNAGVHWLGLLLSGLGLVMAVLALVQPSPVSMAPGGTRARGVTRITRHPLFCGFALWGLGHALVSGFMADVIFFGGFVPFSLAGAWHQDRRKRVGEGGKLAAFYEETSLLPFAAIAGGRNRLVLGEIPWPALLGGVIAAVVLYQLHPWLFGTGS